MPSTEIHVPGWVVSAGAAALGVAVWYYCTRPAYVAPIPEIPKEEPRGFTAADLREFNGIGGKPVYISVKGTVFSVSPNFYGPNGPYDCFAGMECSRCLAKGILGASVELNAGYATLAKDHVETLDGWYDKFMSKYPVMGWFIPDEGFDARGAALSP